jgi:lipoate-protein ligase A
VTFEHRRGSVAELHGLDPLAGVPAAPRLWWCDPVDSAVVLGSRQTAGIVDAERCQAAGLSIVRRRSGGGAVLIEADAVAWADIVVPHGDIPDDVRGSMVWAGTRWRRALEALGADGLDVHAGGLVCTPWSNLVCFAGVGPGEVLRGGAKLVGLSQRRTRDGVRIQGTLYRRPPAVDITGLFVVELPESPLPPPAAFDINVPALMQALAEQLQQP